MDAKLLGFIDHIHHQQYGYVLLHHLVDEVELSFELRGVEQNHQ